MSIKIRKSNHIKNYFNEWKIKNTKANSSEGYYKRKKKCFHCRLSLHPDEAIRLQLPCAYGHVCCAYVATLDKNQYFLLFMSEFLRQDPIDYTSLQN